jgi:hypothetical protein
MYEAELAVLMEFASSSTGTYMGLKYSLSHVLFSETVYTVANQIAGHNGCFTSTFLDNVFLIFVFKHSINYEIKYIKNRKNTVYLKGLLKRKANLDTAILF